MPPSDTAEVVIYTTGFCGYCHAAKRLLEQRGVSYQEVPVDRRPDLRQWLVQASRQNTVPQIFINGQSVGGFSELSGLDRSGRLTERLATPPPPGMAAMPS